MGLESIARPGQPLRGAFSQNALLNGVVLATQQLNSAADPDNPWQVFNQIAAQNSTLTGYPGAYGAIDFGGTGPGHTPVSDGAVVNDVIDADTFRMSDDPDTRYRVAGIDAPEMSTPEGVAARGWALQQLSGQPAQLEIIGIDQYGRLLANVTVDGKPYETHIIEAGHARAWVEAGMEIVEHEQLGAYPVQNPEVARLGLNPRANEYPGTGDRKDQAPTPNLVLGEQSGPTVVSDPLDALTAQKLREGLMEDQQALLEERDETAFQQRLVDLVWKAEQIALFGDDGLIPGDTELEQRLEQDLSLNESGATGMTQNMLDAFTTILNHPDLSQSERADRLDYLFDRTDYATGMNQTLVDLNEEYIAQQSLINMSDYDLLKENDILANFVSRQHLDFGLQPPTEDNLDNMLISLVHGLPLDALPDDLGMQIGDLFWAAMQDDRILEGGEYEHLLVEAAKALSTEDKEYTSTDIIKMIAQLVGEMNDYMTTWNSALDYGDGDSYTPHSEQLGAALKQVALLSGLSEQKAEEYARSAHVHDIIDAMSGGQVGFVGEGTRRGIGGLPASFYEAKYGQAYDEMEITAQTDLYTLIQYMEALGGPQSAVQHFIEHGGWGY